MKIAVVGWGSLVRDPRELRAAANFAPNGPLLPIEFCRVSRGRRLTLVIDETFGAVCTTYSAPSALDTLDAAMKNLHAREDMRDAKGVGFVEVASGKRSDIAMRRHPEAVATIAAWAQSNGYDAAIWTALASNFDEPDKGGELFSVTAAIRYLEALQGQDEAGFASAVHYIRNAPSEVETPVRDEVARRWPAATA
jgi:hypothetical protein